MTNDAVTGSAGTLKSLLEGLKEYGVDPKTVEALTGVTASQMIDADVRIPLANVTRLARKVRELTGEPSIGLKLGTNPAVIYPSGIGWGIMANSPTLLEGINRFARYTKIISEFLRVEVIQEDQQTTVLFTVTPPSFYTSFSMEIILSRFLTTFRQILKKEIKPIAARFKHVCPEYSDEYIHLFGPAVSFDHLECALVFSNDILKTPIMRRDAYLDDFLTRHAEKLLARISSDMSFGLQVKRVIINQLYQGQVDVEMVSKAMNVSRSTLFRKLKEEVNLTFKDILRETRKELAQDYLKNKTMTLSEIAFLLGFSDPSSFNRAFKRWEGVTPIKFRKEYENDSV